MSRRPAAGVISLGSLCVALSTAPVAAQHEMYGQRVGRQLRVQAAEVDCEFGTVTLRGQFRHPESLLVRLDHGDPGGPIELPTLDDSMAGALVVSLPRGCEPPGTYRLSVGRKRMRRHHRPKDPSMGGAPVQFFSVLDVTLGAIGPVGARGATGPAGPPGANGSDGLPGVSCWDLNEDLACDLDSEDSNEDGSCTPLDCQGPQGAPGNVRLAGLRCPDQQFLTGFDLSGNIVCSDLAPDGDDGNASDDVVLAEGQIVEDALESLVGNELLGTFPFDVPLLSGNVNVLGFALCQPSDVGAPPNPSAPLYDCTPDVTVTMIARNDGSQLFVRAEAEAVFVDADGDWTLSLPPSSGNLEGYLLLTEVAVEATATLEDTGNGTKRVGAVQSTSVTYTDSQISVDFGNDVLDAFVSLFRNLLFSSLIDQLNVLLESALDDILAQLPELTL